MQQEIIIALLVATLALGAGLLRYLMFWAKHFESFKGLVTEIEEATEKGDEVLSDIRQFQRKDYREFVKLARDTPQLVSDLEFVTSRAKDMMINLEQETRQHQNVKRHFDMNMHNQGPALQHQEVLMLQQQARAQAQHTATTKTEPSETSFLDSLRDIR